MINPFREIDWNPSIAKRRQFGRVVFIGFLLIGIALYTASWFDLLTFSPPLFIGLAIGAFLGFLSWFLPVIARPIYLVWHLLGASLGIVMSNLLLAAFYYLLLTPFAIVFKLIGRDPLKRRFDPSVSTYWETAGQDVDPKRYFRQF